MPKYSVTIEGSDFITYDAEVKNSQRVGFYAVRYIKAEDAQSAQEYIMDFFLKEVQRKLVETRRSTIRVTQVKTVESIEGYALFEGGIAGTGLMFYAQEDQGFWATWVLAPLQRVGRFLKNLFIPNSQRS